MCIYICIFQVHFASDEDLVIVHPISENTEWHDAYQEARKGPWEQFALDRERFKKRITESETLLNPVLLENHRLQIYNERFSKNWLLN